MNDSLKQEVLEVVSRHTLCVISTVGEQNKPESAIVGFSCDDNLELLIGTSETTRKYRNLRSNPHVAVVIGDEQAEIQYEGTARTLDKTREDKRIQALFDEVPGASKYRDDPSQVYLLITPTWLRLTVHEDPNRVEEMRFGA